MMKGQDSNSNYKLQSSSTEPLKYKITNNCKSSNSSRRVNLSVYQETLINCVFCEQLQIRQTRQSKFCQTRQDNDDSS